MAARKQRIVVDLSSDAPPRGLCSDGHRDDDERPWYTLTLNGASDFMAFPSVGAKDPLRHWPDVYDAAIDTPQWAGAMDWRGVQGCHGNVHTDTGFEPYTVNYAFNYLCHWIPSGVDHRGCLVFDADKSLDTKQRNFYAMLQYIQHYPTGPRMKTDLGMSDFTFYQQVQPTLFCVAQHIDFLEWNLRLWDYNHTEHFPERVLQSYDGFPIEVCASSNKWVRRLSKSKKYGTHVVKADLGIMLASGCPTDYSLQLGVRNDARMHMEHKKRRARIYPWEYALGDKAYVGCPEFLTEFKGGNLPDEKVQWNNMLQFYRGRNEHLVAEIKNGRKALCTRWRGSFLGLAAVLRIVVHLVTLQERMKGPRYDCFGPWPVCPNHIVRQYYQSPM